MSKVRQILENKGHDIWSSSPENSVYEALELMADKNVGALLVLEKGKVVGIFSERDYARKVVLKNKSSRNTSVAQIMTRDVVRVDADESIESCMNKMSEHRIRHLPVMENGELLGIISIGDLVNFVISEQQFKIDQLESYIQGS